MPRDPSLTRRELLHASLTGLTATCLIPSERILADEPEQAAARPVKRDFCLLGFSTYGMKSLGTEQAIEELTALGYDALEISVRTDWDADSAKLTADRRKSLRSLLAGSRLNLTSLMEDVHPADDGQQKLALSRLKLAAALAHDLAPDSPPIVQTVLGSGNWEAQKSAIRDRLAEWVKLGEEMETTIAIKPHRGGALSQPAEAVWLFEQLGQPARLKMVYDYSHYAYRNLPIAETVRIALPYTVHVAIKDAVQEQGKVVFKLPGETGKIDFATIFQQFYAGSYRGDFNCEVSGMVSGQAGYDPLAAAKVCYAKMADIMQQAGIQRPS